MIVGPTVLSAISGSGTAGLCRLVEEDELLDRRHAPPAVLARPAHTQPAVSAQSSDGVAVEPLLLGGLGVAFVRVRRHEPGEVLPQLRAQLLLFGGVFEVHGPSAPRGTTLRRRSP